MTIFRLFFILLIVCSYFSCGIFTPRDEFEDPLVDDTEEDYFKFSKLLSGTGEEFSKLDWYELFDDGFKYTNVRSANIDHSKSDFINHLSQQQEVFPDYLVSWEKKESPLRNIDTITLNNVWYYVREPEVSDSILFSGKSAFVIVRDDGFVWRITRWTDDPNDALFFSPGE